MYARSHLQSASISPESASSAILSVITRISWKLKKKAVMEWTVFSLCFFHLEDEAELAADSNWSKGGGGGLVCWGDVPVARHPGQWPDWVIVTSCD